MLLKRVQTFASNLRRFNHIGVSPERSENEKNQLKLNKSNDSYTKENEKIIKQKKFRLLHKKPFFRWLLIGTITAGTAIYAWQLFAPDYRSKVNPTHYYSDWKIRFYTSLPLNALSRFVGVLGRINIPYSLRELIYGAFVTAYECKMDEALEESLTAYPTFTAFFNRELKSEVRPISNSLLVSPADGTVLHFGKVVDRKIEYVKGNDFEIQEFLGPINANIQEGNSFYQVVVYLAPGDYHAFHSPTTWNIVEKIHHPGYFLSVRPSYLKWIPKLFCLNERVVLSGTWNYGFFSMSAVAATNVGDIVIDSKSSRDKKIREDEDFIVYSFNQKLRHGEKVGEFRIGSTIVLIFEAPSNLKFCIKAGDKLRYGQSLVLQKF